ncbi:MAG: glycosyltransferase family 2 protein [Gelidibacter sp.]|nr:glycosyltransferase family 2 protein [Gelidibacter sp.]
MKPEVSIITPIFNSEAFIKAALDSVLSQSFKNWELILVDDASTDNSISIVEIYLKKHSNITLIKQERNSGTAVCRNVATKAANGNYIAFLDADDIWQPSKLEKQIAFMKTQNIEVCFSSYDLMDEKGNNLFTTIKALPKLTYDKLLKCNYIGNLTGIYNVKTLGKIYTSKLRKRQDWLLWLYALQRSKTPALSVQESLAFYRVRTDGISSNKSQLIKYNFLVYKEGLKFSTLKSLFYLCLFLFEYVFIKPKQRMKHN